MKKDELMKKIYDKHIKQLKYLDFFHEKLVICFSGIAGSGKTYLAKILEEKYKGVRIRTDDVRKIVDLLIKKYKLNPKEKDPIVYEYVEWFLKNHKFKNKLIILDKGIDRTYETLFSVIRKKEYQTFIIRLRASKKVLEKRVFERHKGIDKHFNSEVDRWTNEWKEFGKKVKSDIIIKNEKDNKLNLKLLFKRLNELIK